MDSTVPQLINFVSSSGNDLLNHINNSPTNTSIFLTQKLFSLLSSVLERNSPKQNETSSQVTSATSSRVGSITAIADWAKQEALVTSTQALKNQTH